MNDLRERVLGQLRQVVKRKHPKLEHLLARGQPPTVDDLAAIADADHARGLSLGDVIHADEACDLDLDPYLLEAFAGGRVERALVVVHEAAGQAPLTQRRLDRPPPEHDAPVSLDHHRSHHLGIAPQHEVVVGTSLDQAALDLARDQL